MLIPSQANAVKPERLVVLGANGFVGRALVRLAATENTPVLAPTSRELNLTQADAYSSLASMLQPKDCLVFAAAIDKGNQSTPEDIIQNIAMASQVAQAITQMPIAHLVYLSSDSVYPAATALVHESSVAGPITLYGSMHRTRELILSAYAPAPQAILRLSAIYGEGDTHNAYGPNRFMRQAVSEKKITLFGKGEEQRDHLWVDDAARMIFRTVQMRATGLLNISSGRSRTFAEIAQIIANHTSATIEHTPRRQPVTHRHVDPTERLKVFADIVPAEIDIKLKELCGFLA